MKPRNLYLNNLNLCVQSKYLQIYLCLLQNLVLKVAYLHYSMVLEHIVVLLVDLGLGIIFTLMLAIEFEIMAPSWANSIIFSLLIFVHAWEKYEVLD